MKKVKTYFLLIFSGLVFFGCDKPAPTELTQDEEQLEVEVLARDTEDEFYSADSSGVIDDLKSYTNIVTLSGIKTTIRNATLKSDVAQAIFFDKNKPVSSSVGMWIGYVTRVLGEARFNNVQAKLVPYIKRFRDRGVKRDTTLGFRHALYSLFPGNDFNYEYNSSVGFNFNFFLDPVWSSNAFSFDIPTPSEINGAVKLEGKRENGSLRGVVTWNGEHYPKFEVVLGVSVRGSETVYPLYRIKTPDDGKLIIPKELMNKVSKERFDKYVISLYRKKEYFRVEGENELFILSQSIHSIILDIP